MRTVPLFLFALPAIAADPGATGTCDPGIEGDAQDVCVAYCEVLDCAAPEQIGDPACARVLEAYIGAAPGRLPPCVTAVTP